MLGADRRAKVLAQRAERRERRDDRVDGVTPAFLDSDPAVFLGQHDAALAQSVENPRARRAPIFSTAFVAARSQALTLQCRGGTDLDEPGAIVP